MPGPYNYIDVTFAITVRGDGRDDKLTLRPVTAATFVAWSPPGSLGTVSPLIRHPKNLTIDGTSNIVTANDIANMAPYVPSYVAVVPSPTSNVSLTVGTFGDTGIKLAPNLPAFYAIPNPVPNTWAILYTPGSNTTVDVIIG